MEKSTVRVKTVDDLISEVNSDGVCKVTLTHWHSQYFHRNIELIIVDGEGVAHSVTFRHTHTHTHARTHAHH